MNWKLYYADGTIFSNEDGPPERSPKDFLIQIIQGTPTGTTPVRGDYFTFRAGYWRHHDLVGLVDYLVHHGHEGVTVRKGYYADDKTYREVLEKARLQ